MEEESLWCEIEKGHATWSMVSSKMSVEGRRLRALKLTQDKIYC